MASSETIEKKTVSTRDSPPERIPFHPLSNTFRMMTEDEKAELAADIKENDQHQPIVLYEGMILDGRNRYEACLLAGVAPITVEYDGDDPLGFVISANALRRHLTPTEKQDAIAKLLKADPRRSDRTIAKLARVDHKTVGAKRAAMEDSGELPQVAMRADSKGRSFRAHKKTRSGRSSARLGIGSMVEDEESETNLILALGRLLNEGDINSRLNILLRVLGGEPKKRIAALPIGHQEALARRFLALFEEVRADNLRPIEYVPAMEGALVPGFPRDLQHDEDENGEEESPSSSEIAPAKTPGTLH